jgi:RES domain
LSVPGAAAEPRLVPPPPGSLYRIGLKPDPFTWREPRKLSEDEEHQLGAPVLLAGNRFDAPSGEFRTLYFADSVDGAYLERLSRFRARKGLAEDLDDEADATRAEPLVEGQVPRDLLDRLVVGEVQLEPAALLIDVEDPATLAALTLGVGDRFLRRFGLDRFDRGVVLSRDRRITRPLALELYNMSNGRAVGLRYSSAHNPAGACFALWPTALAFTHEHALAPADLSSPALANAATILGITLPPASAPPASPQGMPTPW